MTSNKPTGAKEFWIRLEDDEEDTIWDCQPLAPLPDHIIHVIEYTAIQSLTARLEEMKAMLEKFITKSNGLSFYSRNEFEEAKLQMNDSTELVYKIQDLYNFQCEVESYLAKKKGE